MDLSGRTIVVTGGTGALGTAVVDTLVSAGARCHVPFVDRKEADAYAHVGREAVTLAGPIDLSAEPEVAAFYAGIDEVWASVHLAGGFGMAPVAETAADDFLGQIRMNATTCFLCCREAVKAIRRSPGAPGGRIVNISARPGLEPRTGAGMAAYAAAKAAVAALTQALGEEVIGEGICVNAVAPSIIDTPANRAAMPEADHTRWVSPADIAKTIAFLVSPETTATRGAVLTVYGKS